MIRAELSDGAAALVAAMVAETDDLAALGVEREEIESIHWGEVRAAFPLGLTAGLLLIDAHHTTID